MFHDILANSGVKNRLWVDHRSEKWTNNRLKIEAIPLTTVEEPSRLPSTRVKKPSPSHKQHVSRAVPRTITLIRPRTLGLFLVDQRNMLIRLNTNPGPDVYLLPQGRISPLSLNIGSQSLLRLTLIKIILNMTHTLLTTGQ